MNIEIDYNPTPSKCYFISVSLNDKEAISFDYTIKGHRIIKQVLIEKKPFPEEKEISGEWDALIFENSKFIKKYHVRWIDMGDKDWVNDEIWKTVLERPVSEELKNKLLNCSQVISDKYEQSDIIRNDLKELENILKLEIAKFIETPQHGT
ncbi:MAG: hypothetical protein Q7S78_00690 [Candidatus Azambacteria bacterium]|nr:hypothetical protein [Candidatus Azambacteria bacterium]